MKPFALLLAIAGFAQAQAIWTSTWANGASVMGGVHFVPRSEPASPPLPFIGASSSRTIFGPQGVYSATHRYFRDDASLTYVGYDLLIEQGPQPDMVRVTFLDLGIGPLDFAMGPGLATPPKGWKKLATPPLPESRIVHAGDRIDLAVWIDANTGQKLVDIIELQQSIQSAGPRILPSPGVLRSPVGSVRTGPTVPTVEGTAREFHAEDAEMHLVQPRITLNGAAEVLPHAGNAATGTLVWFYLPKRGRYILSLAPRAELGFVKAGEVRGGAIQFKLDGDELMVETYQPIAPGSSPYLLYVLHDKEWQPTAVNQVERLLFGSVSPAELIALMKK